MFEHSIYLHKALRGRGYVEVLMKRLVEIASQRELHVLVGVIDVDNRASITLHEKLGFTHSGTLSQVGFKFGRWLDVDVANDGESERWVSVIDDSIPTSPETSGIINSPIGKGKED